MQCKKCDCPITGRGKTGYCRKCKDEKTRKDITGQKFGRLTAIRFSEMKKKRSYWVFRCECGVEKIIYAQCVTAKNGSTKSCGCLSRENNRKARHLTHGFSRGGKRNRFFVIWEGISNRCKNKKNDNYFWYGGRGTKNEWNTIERFRDDMYESYLKHVAEYGEKQTTIDRINNNGNYCRDNCKWSTWKEQQNNRRNNKKNLLPIPAVGGGD